MITEDKTEDRAAAPPTIMHTVECGRSTMMGSHREIEATVREGIVRMVAVLVEAGGPVPATEVCRRLHEDGGIPYWPEVQMTALGERTVSSPEDGMLCLPQKRGPGMSPEDQAHDLAFEKAERLGVIRHTGELYVLTDRQDEGLLTHSELEMAERWMNCCNALGAPDAQGMHKLWHEGKITKEELYALRRDVVDRAAAQPLAHAQARAQRLASKEGALQ